MMPFRYFLDTAYVVPHLRKRQLGLPMNRRKSVIVGAVLLAHGGLIWGLVNFIAPVPPPIEFVETQVILEQITPEQPTPMPIPVVPQVQQKVVHMPVVQPTQQLKVNENAEIKQAVKSTVEVTTKSAPTPQTQATPAVQEPARQQEPTKPQEPVKNRLSSAECSDAVKLELNPKMTVISDKNVRLLIRRNGSNRAASVNLLNSTGDAALDAWVERAAHAKLWFFKDGEQCDGVQGSVVVKVNAND